MSNTANTWQPIETAPANTQILATWIDTWIPIPWSRSKPHTHIELVENFGGKWFYCYDGESPNHAPTHWMPIPDAPIAEMTDELD